MKKNLEKLTSILADKFGVPPEEITPEANLTADFNMTALEINDLIGIITSVFDLVLPQENDFGPINTVTDLLGFIDAYSQEL